MAMLKKGPRTVSQITSNLQKIVDELELSEQQYAQKMAENAEKMARIRAENDDISSEMTRNTTVKGKLKDLLGY